MCYESVSREETFFLGEQFGSKVKPGEIYCLTGDLAAGKTVFTKGFGRGLGVVKEITSPTFTIVNTYKGRVPFYHFDVYRIQSAAEMDDTGYEEYFFGDGVCLIEWAENVTSIIPSDAVWIRIERDMKKGENYRRLSVMEP